MKVALRRALAGGAAAAGALAACGGTSAELSQGVENPGAGWFAFDGDSRTHIPFSGGFMLCVTQPGAATITGMRWKQTNGLVIRDFGLGLQAANEQNPPNDFSSLRGLGYESQRRTVDVVCRTDDKYDHVLMVGLDIESSHPDRNVFGQELLIDYTVNGTPKTFSVPIGTSICAKGTKPDGVSCPVNKPDPSVFKTP